MRAEEADPADTIAVADILDVVEGLDTPAFQHQAGARRPPTARQALAVIARAPGGGLRLLELTAGAPFLQQKWVGALRLIVDNATRVGELAAAGDL
jgi:hypothetical protein